MKTKNEKMQDFVRYYREKTGKVSIEMREVAEEAKRMGWKLPTPKTAIELLAAQFSDSQREEFRKDEVTGRPYRANLAVTERQGGTQLVLWTDIDAASRYVAHKALTQYREQMIVSGWSSRIDAVVGRDLGFSRPGSTDAAAVRRSDGSDAWASVRAHP